MSDSENNHRSSPDDGAAAAGLRLAEAPVDLLRFALEAPEVAFWAWSPGAAHVVVSPGCHALLGTDPAATVVALDDFWREVHPEDVEAAREAVEGAVAGGGEGFAVELRRRRGGGDWRWYQARGRTTARDETGATARVLGTLVDVTERREAEAALRQSEERYRQLVESQGEGIGIVDGEERFLFANPAAESIFGVDPGGLVGRSLEEFLDAEQYARILDQTSRRREGSRDTYEIELGRPDGESRTILVTATRRADEAGAYSGAFGVFRDITDRKRAERAVRESEERYRQLIESLPHGVGVVTRDEIKYVNSAGARILGYGERGELVGRGPLAFLAAGEEEHVRDQLRSLALGEVEGPVHYFARGLRQDGGLVPLEVYVTRVTYGGAPAFQVFMMDVSEREEAEHRRAQLEEQLRQAHRLESIGRLAGGIAHDFNNILTPVLSLAEVAALEVPPGGDLRKDLDTIVEAAERGRELTQQLLAFGRKQVLRMRVLDLNRAVADSHGMLRRLIPENFGIDLDLTPGLGAVRADEGQVHQVLMNLTLNARDSMPEGGRITIRTADVEVDADAAERLADLEPGPFVVLEVRDEGCGMDAETAARIFEPFFSTKAKGRGTGLGLAMVHGIVKQHGGHVAVETTPGAGTSFSIYLPRVQDEVSKPEQGSWSMEEGTREATVLVAEDDGAVRRSARRVLCQKGFEVIEARDGEEALVLARRHRGPIDVLLTDVIMPRMDGPELAQRLALARPETTVVFMSGYTDDHIARTGVLEEGVLFLQKPFSARSLLEMIDEALRGRPRPTGMSSAPPPPK